MSYYDTGPSTPNMPAIIGGVFGGFIGLIILLTIVRAINRDNRQRQVEALYSHGQAGNGLGMGPDAERGMGRGLDGRGPRGPVDLTWNEVTPYATMDLGTAHTPRTGPLRTGIGTDCLVRLPPAASYGQRPIRAENESGLDRVTRTDRLNAQEAEDLSRAIAMSRADAAAADEVEAGSMLVEGEMRQVEGSGVSVLPLDAPTHPGHIVGVGTGPVSERGGMPPSIGIEPPPPPYSIGGREP